MIAVIIGCEIGFWILLAAGLIARYPLRLPRLGWVLLASTPVVDLVLLVASVIDLRNGSTPSIVHAIAAIYIGISIAFGRRTIAWADAWFAHRYAGGPRPDRPARHGAARAARERAGWYRHLLAFAIGGGLLLAAAAMVDTEAARAMFHGVARVWLMVLGIDAVISFSYTLWPSSAKDKGVGEPGEGHTVRVWQR